MFADPDVTGAGLSAASISSLFIIWSICSFLFEIPTGIVADRVPRRRLLVIGPLLTAAGFALWTWWPSYAAFAAGFVLWSAGSALRSGTLQALLYDTLAARGQAQRYAALAGRVRAMGACGVLVGTVAAVPLTAWGGYQAAGAASIGSCVVCAAASAMLAEEHAPQRVRAPRHNGADVVRPDGTEHPVDTEQRRSDGPVLTDPTSGRGVIAAVFGRFRADRILRRVLLLVIALTWVGALDEYLPLLADEMWSGPTSGVAVLMVVVACGDIAGGYAAERTDVGDFRPRRLAPWLVLGAVALGIGAASGHPAGIILVAFAFGVFGWSLVMADAMLQDRVPSGVRATITSVVGVGEEVVAVAAFGAWAVGSAWLPPTALFAVAALPYAVLGVMLWRVLPGATTARASAR